VQVVALKKMVYLETYFKHKPRNVRIDGTLAKVKVQELQIARWTLIKEQQLTKFNMGTKEKP
jgi:hypothetical protein